MVHGLLPILPISLLPTPLFSDSNTSIYTSPALFPSSLDPAQSQHCVWASMAAMGLLCLPVRGRRLWWIPPPHELSHPWSTAWYLCWDCSHNPLIICLPWKVEYMYSGNPNTSSVLTKSNITYYKTWVSIQSILHFNDAFASLRERWSQINVGFCLFF